MHQDTPEPAPTDDSASDVATRLERLMNPGAPPRERTEMAMPADVKTQLEEIARFEKERLAIEVERLELIKQRHADEKIESQVMQLIHGSIAEVQMGFDDLEKTGAFDSISSEVERSSHMAVLTAKLDTVMNHRGALSDPDLLQQIKRLHSQRHALLDAHWKGDNPVELTRKKAAELAAWAQSVRQLEEKARAACESVPTHGSENEAPAATRLDEISHELGELYKQVTVTWGCFLEILPHDKVLPRQCLEDLAGCTPLPDSSDAPGNDPKEICQSWFGAIALVHPDSKHGIAAELVKAADELRKWPGASATKMEAKVPADEAKKPRDDRPRVQFSGVSAWSSDEPAAKKPEPAITKDVADAKPDAETQSEPAEKPAEAPSDEAKEEAIEEAKTVAPNEGRDRSRAPMLIGVAVVLAAAAAGYFQQRQTIIELQQKLQSQHAELTARLINQDADLREQFAAQLKTENAALREQLPAEMRPREESLRGQLELLANKLNILEQARAEDEARARAEARAREEAEARDKARIAEEAKAREMAAQAAKDQAAKEKPVVAAAPPPPVPVPAPPPVTVARAIPITPKRTLPANAKPSFVNSIGMTFVPIMIEGGQTNGQVVYFSQFETRAKEFSTFVKADKYAWKQLKKPQPDDHPAVGVNWDDAREFCEWLGRKEALPYRLPSDHEWSMAVGGLDEEASFKVPREKDGRTPNQYPWGSLHPPPLHAGNYGYPGDGFEKTAPVGSFPPNANNLYDMGGNVWEWCYDEYVPNSAGDRVLRGGSWLLREAPYMLSSYRLVLAPGSRFDYYGFRVVFTLPINGLPESASPAKKTEKK